MGPPFVSPEEGVAGYTKRELYNGVVSGQRPTKPSFGMTITKILRPVLA